MTNPLKVFITLVIIVLIGIGFYFTNYQKKIQEITKLDVEVKTQKAELERVELLAKEMPNLIKEREELEIELQNKLKEKIGHEEIKDFVPNYLTQIEQLVKSVRGATGDLSFDLLSLTPGGAGSEQAPGAPAEEGKPKGTETPTALASYPTRNFEMSMKGKYNTLIYFLDQLGELKLKRLVTIDKIGLSPSETASAGLSPVLSISLPIKAYLSKGGGR